MNAGNLFAAAVFAASWIPSFGLDAATLTPLYSFKGGGDGEYPDLPLTFVEGTLYGVTCDGGSPGLGTIFRVNPDTGAEKVIHRFTYGSRGGTCPSSQLAFQSGLLYGTALYTGTKRSPTSGYGTIFNIDPKSGAETVLHTFTGRKDGGNPLGGLLYLNGAFYGTAHSGRNGADIFGTLYEIDPTTGTLTVVYQFVGGANAAYPDGGLLYAAGALYGTSFGPGCGAVYMVSPTTGAEMLVHLFTGGKDGCYPSPVLTLDNDAIFGTTYQGGASDSGVIFKIDITDGSESVVNSFASGDGNGAKTLSVRRGSVHRGSGSDLPPGVLYGATFAGGTQNDGTLFTLDFKSKVYTTLYSFTGEADGLGPEVGPTYHDGAFYGTAVEGGTSGYGTVYKFVP
jgi:uncharacterized repeat protein (TIGR03803 family)